MLGHVKDLVRIEGVRGSNPLSSMDQIFRPKRTRGVAPVAAGECPCLATRRQHAVRASRFGASFEAAPVSIARAIAAGGMAGWQIILIALGAALAAAAAAVLLYRVLVARRAAPATTA